MQIQNFYTDWLPAPSSDLECIVLGPHTLNPNDFALSGMQDDYCDSHSRVYICDLNPLDPLAPEQKYNNGTCPLKKCMSWFRNRRPSRREK
jgi:hypothetical protein